MYATISQSTTDLVEFTDYHQALNGSHPGRESCSDGEEKSQGNASILSGSCRCRRSLLKILFWLNFSTRIRNPDREDLFRADRVPRSAAGSKASWQ